jgi:hypothetical protein
MVGERVRGLDGQSIGEQMSMFRQPGGMLEDWKCEFRRLGAREGMWVHRRVCQCVGGHVRGLGGRVQRSAGVYWMVGGRVREGKAGW